MQASPPVHPSIHSCIYSFIHPTFLPHVLSFLSVHLSIAIRKGQKQTSIRPSILTFIQPPPVPILLRALNSVFAYLSCASVAGQRRKISDHPSTSKDYRTCVAKDAFASDPGQSVRVLG